jgi:glycosyltransferase involved in cell wall biosynthesis
MASRILLFDSGKEWGGGTNSMIELLKRIDRSRFAVTPLFFDNYARGRESDLRQSLAEIGLQLELLPRRQQPLWAKIAKELARGLMAWSPRLKSGLVFQIEKAWRIKPDARRIADVLKAGKYDMLYLNNQPSSNLEGLLAAEMVEVPVVQHCRIEATLNVNETNTLNRVVCRVICVSHGVAESLIAQGVDSTRCSVVLNGVDGRLLLPITDVVRHQPGLANASVVVGTIGSLVPRKGVLSLLAALQSIPDSSVLGLIVGDGPQRKALESESENLGIADRVVFAGFQREPLEYLAAMDIFCLLSAREGLPRVILEAMLLGKPVIATDIPGSRELVRHGESGFLVLPGDKNALTTALTRLIADKELRTKMGQRGREIVLANYSIERYVQGVEQIFDEALA